MTDTPARLLRLLSLLQTPREWPGSELAERLGVSPRTIRRDIDRLRELDYPVQASMGAEGGYRLAAGKAMPPLLLDDEEAVAIAVGLRAAAGHAVDGIEEASVRALAKLSQVLPSRLQRRVAALSLATEALLGGDGPTVDPDDLATISSAIASGERLRFRYAEDGRHVEPQRLVATRQKWYLVAWDLDRADWRIFRVDRLSEPRQTGARATPRELPAKDAAAYVASKLFGRSPTYEAVITLEAPVEVVRRRMGGAKADLVALDEHRCRLRAKSDSVRWIAFRVLTLDCDFTVEQPPELAAYLRTLSDRTARAAGS
jgi:predicted DNA-binding transcriptional regulator YafY